jgi:hypothetical protein
MSQGSTPETPSAAVADPSDSTHEEPKQKKQNDDLDYEVEFATPFGKLEFEFEPVRKKEKKDRERKEKAEREAAKKALKAAERAAARSAESNERGGRGIFGTLMIIVLVLALIGAVIALAYWLFARPGEEEDDDAVPPEFAQEPQPAAGLVARIRGRARDALRAGRQASREAQREQREKFEQMSGSGR